MSIDGNFQLTNKVSRKAVNDQNSPTISLTTKGDAAIFQSRGSVAQKEEIFLAKLPSKKVPQV